MSYEQLYNFICSENFYLTKKKSSKDCRLHTEVEEFSRFSDEFLINPEKLSTTRCPRYFKHILRKHAYSIKRNRT